MADPAPAVEHYPGVLVIGGGPAGLMAAEAARAVGATLSAR